jgi:phosphoglycolate phosphatase
MQHLIFDLDGTVSNPEVGILNGYKYTFPKVNLTTPNDDVLKKLIGPPLRTVFEKMYGLSSAQAEFAITTYRVYYNELGGAYENELYIGMKALLDCLFQQKRILHIATHKGAMAEQILTHFEIRKYFSQIQHYNEEKGITTKEKMIELIMQSEQITDKNNIVMIGDRNTDIEAANYHQIKSIGVTYGFGSKQELENTKPTFLVDTVAELHNILHQK